MELGGILPQGAIVPQASLPLGLQLSWYQARPLAQLELLTPEILRQRLQINRNEVQNKDLRQEGQK
jgi:hypothetical protein